MSKHESSTLLGFDIRIRADVPRTVDCTVWEQAEISCHELMQAGYKENLIQLFECSPQAIENQVGEDAIGVGIAVVPSGLRVIEAIVGGAFIGENYDGESLLTRGWTFEGYDVADANGYFSVFGIDRSKPKLNVPKNLFSDFEKANESVKIASQFYPSHTPFVVFLVFTFDIKRRVGGGVPGAVL